MRLKEEKKQKQYDKETFPILPYNNFNYGCIHEKQVVQKKYG